MDVNQLKTLIHVAELGSLSKTADRLNIAQPALSRQIRLLEEELGVQVFERHGRGMVLTSMGAEILEHATHIMSEMDAIRNTALDGKSSFRGIVKIGVTPTVSQVLSVPLVQKIREAHPQLKVRIIPVLSGFLIDWLKRGDLDVIVSYNPPAQRSLRTIPIMMENLFLVGGASSGLSQDKAVQFTELADKELILPCPRHGLRTLMDEYARRAGIELNINVEVDSFSALVGLAQNELGVTVLPIASIHSLIDQGELRVAPLVDPAPERKLVLAFAADHSINPAARFAGEVIIETARDLVRRNLWSGHMLDDPKGI
ncbi:LysR substrate-binding domain-containing protein [Terasakiella sp. SH-1]|uniref:LysR family transcriptional regulator n=1 Tax=Terasakiella sp. SH-1 TaxID=2560057 RepID=UPI001073068C|nr:LysR substrate-binding domain-containing protein [Terasakiella sp. SH-1]